MDFDALYLRVLKFLNFRPRSEKEIRDYLKKILSSHVIASKAKQSYKEIATSSATPRNDETITDLIIHKLKQQKFLNDKEFARVWVRSRTNFKPKGERLIRLELQQKGVRKEDIDEAFESFDFSQEESLKSSRNDKELAMDLLERKRKKYEGMDRQERFTKAGSMLARRGFDLSDIKWAIDQVFGKMV